jgi:hypothetical protein
VWIVEESMHGVLLITTTDGTYSGAPVNSKSETNMDPYHQNELPTVMFI